MKALFQEREGETLEKDVFRDKSSGVRERSGVQQGGGWSGG